MENKKTLKKIIIITLILLAIIFIAYRIINFDYIDGDDIEVISRTNGLSGLPQKYGCKYIIADYRANVYKIYCYDVIIYAHMNELILIEER